MIHFGVGSGKYLVGRVTMITDTLRNHSKLISELLK